MSECARFDALVTPYVDGELPPDQLGPLEQHLRRCPPCHSRVSAERTVRQMLHGRRETLERGCAASQALKSRCAAACRPCGASDSGSGGARSGARLWQARIAPFAVAVTLVVIVGGAVLYQATESSSHVLAAELTADHVKCFALNSVLRTRQSRAAVESAMLDGFDWTGAVPDASGVDLELVGARQCFYGEGKLAHVMYTHHGTPVSLFMLPGADRQQELVKVLGHECAIWSAGDRTFALIAREQPADVARMAAVMQASLH